MKAILFDLTRVQPIADIKFHGGGKYGEIVFKKLAGSGHKGVIAYYNLDKWINPAIIAICEKNSVLVVDAKTISLTDAVKKYNVGVVYSPIIDRKIDTLPAGVLYAVTIHGLRVLELPFDVYKSSFKLRLNWLYKLYYYWKKDKEFKKELSFYRNVFSKKNVKAITVSEHSKASIMSFIPNINNNDINVFYSPSTIEVSHNNETSMLNKGNEYGKYYLMVSANRWEKNAIRAVKAFDAIFSERPNFEGKVVLTGTKDKVIFDRYIRNKNRFVFLEYVDDAHLHTLYKGAYLFMYPSLNEGFGYPPLEAMSKGTPVVASAIASIPEICGDAALYFNPLLVSEIKMRILQMEDMQIREEYIKKGRVRFDFIKQKQDIDLQKMVEYILSFVAEK